MPIIESKVREGVLSFGGASPMDFSCQATNVRIVPSHNTAGDEIETLCGDTLTADTTTTWSLQGTSVQDFSDANGLIRYTIEHNLTEVPFTWQPNPTGLTVSGTVGIRALEFGGDVNTRLTTDFEFPISGDPTFDVT